jgi:hypothetical protein
MCMGAMFIWNCVTVLLLCMSALFIWNQVTATVWVLFLYGIELLSIVA